MAVDIENFRKFIVKQIVNTVDYNPEKDEYEINRIHISDDIIRTIEAEGTRYGFDGGQVRQIIAEVSDNIRTSPSSEIKYNSVDVSTLKKGQHLRLQIQHPDKGMRYVDILCLGAGRFMVLESDILGITYGDELCALDLTWNMSFYIDFQVCRGAETIPDKDSILRLGKLYCVELFFPSVVNDILDSESDFTFDSANGTEVEGTKKPVSKDYYFWIPNKYQPATFCWKVGDRQDEKATYVLTDYDGSTNAKIVVNKSFELPDEQNESDLVAVLLGGCTWRNRFEGTDNLKCIKTVKAGKVKRIKSELGEKEWELVCYPQIKFVYG